jgi:hypothetical protein
MARSRARITHANVERHAKEHFSDPYQDLSDVPHISIEILNIEELHLSSRPRKHVQEGSATTRVLLGHADNTT